jgi:uncharacterized membrane protein (UPF0127 family)
VSVVRTQDQRVVASAVRRAAAPWERSLGLLGRRRLEPGAGLWLEPARAIHTIGMMLRLDIVVLDRSHRVIAIHRGVPPFRFVAHPHAHAFVELGAGSLDGAPVAVGDELAFCDPAVTP